MWIVLIERDLVYHTNFTLGMGRQRTRAYAGSAWIKLHITGGFEAEQGARTARRMPRKIKIRGASRS